MGEWQKVASLIDLDPDYPSCVRIGDREFALCLIERAVFAINNICSHAFARLSDGHLEGYEIVCPLHQGRFDVRTGVAVAPPCYVPISVVEAKIVGEDVHLKVPADIDASARLASRTEP